MKLNKETAIKVAKTIWFHKFGKAAVTTTGIFLLGLTGLKVAPETVHDAVDMALVVLTVL